MSPAKGEGLTVGFHFTWYHKHDELLRVLPILEKALAPFMALPHQGKMFVLSGQYYERAYKDDLVKLRNMIVQHDPKGKFRNEFIDKYIFGKNELAKL